jgi:hypothetical protein
MKALLLVLALSGCYVTTRDTLVETPISTAKQSTTMVTASQPDVVANTRANVISFRVETRRMCQPQTSQEFEVVRSKKPALDMSVWIIPVGIVVPAVFALVPAVSGLVALTQKSETRYTETRVTKLRSYACALRLGDHLVRVQFPSGASFEARTNEQGLASVTIPDDEVDHGTARIELPNLTRTIDYDRRSYDAEQLAVTADE